MTTLFWIGIVLHVFLCLFLMLLVLVQNDKMGGLAGLGGMTSQSAFSTAGAATFIQKLTRVVAVIFFIVVFALGLITAKQNTTAGNASALDSANATAEAPAQDAGFGGAPAEFTPAATLPAEAPAAAPAPAAN